MITHNPDFPVHPLRSQARVLLVSAFGPYAQDDQYGNLPVNYAGALWAAGRRYQDDPHRSRLISQILDELYDEFGWKARLAAPIVGRYLYHTLRREERRLQHGWTYEPPTFYETNSADGPATAVRVVGVATSAASADPESHNTPDTMIRAAKKPGRLREMASPV